MPPFSCVIQPIVALISGAVLAGEGKAIASGMIMAFVNRMALVVLLMEEVSPWLAKRRSVIALREKWAEGLSTNTCDDGEKIPSVLSNANEINGLSFSYDEDTPVLKGINA